MGRDLTWGASNRRGSCTSQGSQAGVGCNPAKEDVSRDTMALPSHQALRLWFLQGWQTVLMGARLRLACAKLQLMLIPSSSAGLLAIEALPFASINADMESPPWSNAGCMLFGQCIYPRPLSGCMYCVPSCVLPRREMGETAVIGYFTQHTPPVPNDMKVISYIR